VSAPGNLDSATHGVVTRRIPTTANLRWLWLSGLVIVVDQSTKHLMRWSFRPGEDLPLTPFASLVLAFNRGAAFSFLAGETGWQRWLFTVLAIAVSVALVLWLKRIDLQARVLAAAVALILGGALGNLWDRLTTGRVVDFLLVYIGSYPWPAFNVADSAIVVGAGLLVIEVLFSKSATAEKSA